MIASQHDARIHVAATFSVVALGIFLDISRLEWAALVDGRFGPDPEVEMRGIYDPAWRTFMRGIAGIEQTLLSKSRAHVSSTDQEEV